MNANVHNALIDLGALNVTLALSFRPLAAADLTVLHRWLNEEPVLTWYSRRPYSLREVHEKYLPRINWNEPVDVFVFTLAGVNAGLIQSYALANFPEYCAALQGERDWAAIDFFIGEAAFRGKGLAVHVLRRFVDEVIFASGHSTCCSSPLAVNQRSLRTLASAGFRKVRMFQSPDGDTECLMVRSTIHSLAPNGRS